MKNRRNVTVDSNVFISHSVSKGKDTVGNKALAKIVSDDMLMLTDVIYDECMKYAGKPKAKVTKDVMDQNLRELSEEIIVISPIPPDAELKKKYKIRDDNDLKVLYSADATDSSVIISDDYDFFDGVEGIKAVILRPWQYLFEEEIEKEKEEKNG